MARGGLLGKLAAPPPQLLSPPNENSRCAGLDGRGWEPADTDDNVPDSWKPVHNVGSDCPQPSPKSVSLSLTHIHIC